MPIDTSSTQGIYDAIRARLLSFAPMGGGLTLDTLLRRLPSGALTAAGTARLYVLTVPADAVYPYGIVTLTPRTSDGAHQGEREATGIELQLVHRPRSKFWDLQALADLADQAMLRWADGSSGFLGSKERIRQTIPQPPVGAPADREVVQELIRYPIIAWPTYLTQYKAA